MPFLIFDTILQCDSRIDRNCLLMCVFIFHFFSIFFPYEKTFSQVGVVEIEAGRDAGPTTKVSNRMACRSSGSITELRGRRSRFSLF